MKISDGWIQQVSHYKTAHCDQRPDGIKPTLLVIHNISLPPGEFGQGYVAPFFMGQLNPEQHEFFREIYQMRVSAHCFIERTGRICQFVSFDERAWHAGVSVFQGQPRCNDFSIGVEMEGTDHLPYTAAQYDALVQLTKALMVQYPEINLARIVGHNDIAFGRKTDPGEAFDWGYYRQALEK
ncbi:1,6-anhydro-N-acetylmuramyl-L-alanine amidase AmpD [Planctobacterium marinum]|uniref:1,6-anhydro-N-acetylmuramyl-L-alanine amidase AmpD n=1 Tax=Planctobacterium marinum TaxID=1631968 RepID=UPI001E64DE4D|nr:1,6-anhydro-N-acetylmuramyl-L-alanine amidase AmpD [Planctobacterium marinum]MCC2605408.1 1,6-anhydro-N-acetylmuramyl-L-alanine amidase AmpD [Planctobacterium marinum]